MRLPDFIVIGAMKCGTSSLHDQLARRPGLFLSEPKEPNFFSDDDQYARGLAWYASLFAAARPAQRCGESSTHYTKLPTHPHAAERMRACLAAPKLVYVMRDPFDRIVSQYIHEWTEREVQGSLDEAVRRHERYLAYSCYARQLEPYVRAYGRDSILLVAFERMLARPDEELARVCRFIGDPSPATPRWDSDLGARNVSSERLRRSALRDALLGMGAVRALKDRVPKRLRDRAKGIWRMRRRPAISPALRAELEPRLDEELARLGAWAGRELSCRGWREQVLAAPLEWADARGSDVA
jgi:hypothetical protein